MSTLTIAYEGYWQCRQATDPDPSFDWRGASGYTFAAGWENDMDQLIRLQRDELDPRDFRAIPGEPSTEHFGVRVTGVEREGRPWGPGEALVGGKVRWLPAGQPDQGPRFEMRNQITFHPKAGVIVAIPIVPFHIQVASDDEAILLSRDDPIDPSDPQRPLWQIADSAVYQRRCPQRFVPRSDEVLEAMGLRLGLDRKWDTVFNTYFQRRLQWVELALDELATRRRGGELPEDEYRVQRAALELREWALSSSDSFEDRLGLMCEWEHELLGAQARVDGEERLGGRVATDQPWHVRFWMGGFDGDLHRGLMRGSLTVPFEPHG